MSTSRAIPTCAPTPVLDPRTGLTNIALDGSGERWMMKSAGAIVLIALAFAAAFMVGRGSGYYDGLVLLTALLFPVSGHVVLSGADTVTIRSVIAACAASRGKRIFVGGSLALLSALGCLALSLIILALQGRSRGAGLLPLLAGAVYLGMLARGWGSIALGREYAMRDWMDRNGIDSDR